MPRGFKKVVKQAAPLLEGDRVYPHVIENSTTRGFFAYQVRKPKTLLAANFA